MATTTWRPGSTHVAECEFDDQTDTLTVTFQDGRSYDYMNVPAAVARAFQNAPSAGEFLNRQIKGRYGVEER